MNVPEDEDVVRLMLGGPLAGRRMKFRRETSRLIVPNSEGGPPHVYEVPSSIGRDFGPWEERPMRYIGTEES